MTERPTVACTSLDRPRRRFPGVRTGILGVVIVGAAVLQADIAAADFRICNNTGSRVGVALGYKDSEHWTTEGWWNLSARTCETLMRGTLAARYYYVYAVDYDRSGEWGGRAHMCTREKGSLTFRLIGQSGDSRSRVRISPCSSAGCNGHTAKRSLRGRKRYKSGTSLQHTDELKVQNTIEVFNAMETLAPLHLELLR